MADDVLCLYIYKSCEPSGSGELKTTRIDVYETLEFMFMKHYAPTDVNKKALKH